MNYKSKKTIIIASIVLALIIITGFAVGLFLKGNDTTEALGGNDKENTINNNTNENEQNNISNNTEQNNSEQNNEGNQENVEQNKNENNQETNNTTGANVGNTNNNTNNNANTGNNTNTGNANANTGTGNNNTANVPNREYISERVEIIPERVIAEKYEVTWEPTKFDTLINEAITLQKAQIQAEKTVAKVTEAGLEQNPESVKVGETLKYTITIKNTSTKINGSVNIKDTIPEGTEFISATETNLKTTPQAFTNPSEVTGLEWKNIKVKASSEVKLEVFVKVIAKSNEKATEAVKNVAVIYDGTGEEEVPSEETKVANITAVKESKIIYNEEKPHEHIIEGGKEPLHELDIIEYTIKLTNVGQAEGTVKVKDTVPEGTTLINSGVVTVVDKNGENTYTIQQLAEGINVTVDGIKEEATTGKIAGIATVTFKVIVNPFEEDTKTIINDQAKVDGTSTNTTEDEAEKIYTSKTATKIWEDDNNKIGIRPESIELTLVQDGVETSNKLTANANNNWTVEFTDLNKYTLEGNEIVYTIKEAQVANYKAPKYSEDGLTVTNTIDYLSIKTSKTATKIWEDDNNKIGIRPESIELTLVQDGVETQNKLTASEENNWTVEFTDLDKYTIEGNEIVYTIKEAQVANYKAPKYSEDGLTVTNTIDYTSFTISKTITKIWEDNSNLYVTRPESVKLTLNGTDYILTSENDEDKSTLDQWSMTISKLPKYDEKGNEIEYKVVENEIPAGYTKISEEGTTVVNRADPIAEKTAYKAEQDGTIGSEVVDTDLFKSNEIVYYKLTFKNAGNTTIESKVLTDIMPLRINMLEIDGKDVTTGTTSGTDSNGHIWTLTKNERGNTIITWNLVNIPAGEIDELTIKAQVVEDVEYKHLCGLYGETTNYTANLYVRKDGKIPYQGSGLSQEDQYYTNSLGTVYLKETSLENNTEENLKNDDLYYIVKNNNTISDMISRSISREELEKELAKNGITLTNEEIVVWYVIKNENSTYRIEGVIRKASDIKSITNVLYMDNVQVEETIILEDVETEQRGSVSIQGMQSTTSVVSTPMDVVFILDTSGSMGNKLSGQKGSKANSMVNAVNATIQTIMSKNADSRIGIVGYSNSASVIIPLGNYSHTGNYLTLETSGGTKYIQSNVGNKSDRTVTGGTNTQAGIKLGAEMLTANNLDRSFTTTANGVQVTGTRTPVIILVTDGEPTYYYSNETATGTRNGDGNGANQNYYYWTLRTANYYKEQVRKQYYGTSHEQAKMFTIGIGLDGTLPTTMLKPNQTNVDLCKNSSDKSEEKKLYNLLNSSGTPYAYDYADGTATGALTEENIKDFLTTSINSSTTSLIIRAITADEASARRVDLTDIDTAKAFTLEIIAETTTQYNTLNDAITAGYVKQDSTGYYVDLTNVTRGTAVNISYWHVE